MSGTIDQELSVCIYGVKEKYANEKYIKNLFSKLDIADVYFVQIERNIYNNNYNAFIYINKWHQNVMVENLQKKIIDKNLDARLVYDDPHYWILHKNENLMNTQTIIQHQSNQIAVLESRNEILEKKLSDMDERIQLHSASIDYLASKINVDKKVDLFELYKNNSCCGAASSGWVPSYSQEEQSNKLPFLHWQNRLHMRANEKY